MSKWYLCSGDLKNMEVEADNVAEAYSKCLRSAPKACLSITIGAYTEPFPIDEQGEIIVPDDAVWADTLRELEKIGWILSERAKELNKKANELVYNLPYERPDHMPNEEEKGQICREAFLKLNSIKIMDLFR